MLAIVVLYNCSIGEAKSVLTILRNHEKFPRAFEKFKLILYDNSPVSQTVNINLPFEYQYVHDPENKGLAVAYNYALKDAIGSSREWLLLLDHDSGLPDDFIENLTVECSGFEKDRSVVAVVPKVHYKNIFFSPSKVLYGGTIRPIDMRHKGICPFQAFAIGSGSAIRVAYLQSIGGFNGLFWMDCLDRWLYLTINNSGGKVYVTNSIMEHELSIMNYDVYMSEGRYRNILKYETLFMNSFKSRAENYVYYLRLVKRIFYLRFTVKNPIYSSMTFHHLVGLLFPGKKSRNENAAWNR